MPESSASHSLTARSAPLIALAAVLLSVVASAAPFLGAAACAGGDCSLLPLLKESRLGGTPLAIWGVLYFLQIGWLSLLHGIRKDASFLAPALALLLPGLGVSAVKTWQLLVVLRIACGLCLLVQLLHLLLAAALLRTAVRDGGWKPWRINPGAWASTAAVLLFGALAVPPLLQSAERSAIEQELEQFRSEPPVDLRAAPGIWLRGGPAAPQEFTVVSDFACSACAELKSLLLKTDARISIRMLMAPVPRRSDPKLLAARVAVVAADQGRFGDIQEDLFDGGGGLDRPGVDAIARKLGRKPEEFWEELQRGQVLRRVEDHSEAVRVLGIRERPALFLNGRRVRRWDLPQLPEILVRWCDKK